MSEIGGNYGLILIPAWLGYCVSNVEKEINFIRLFFMMSLIAVLIKKYFLVAGVVSYPLKGFLFNLTKRVL